MTTTVNERLQAQLQRVAEQGGLASFKELDEIMQLVMDLDERLGDIRADTVTVADAYGDEISIPFPVTTENVAALGRIAFEIRDALPDLERCGGEIGRYLFAIDGVRRAQEAADDA
jgi:hypothetical protein